MNDLRIGYTLSSEEIGPIDLVRYARLAEEAEFAFASISDHFHPWLEEQGESPFVFSTIGAISQVTQTLEIGIGVNCPILRYHPAIVAQAAATCAILMEDRFFLGVGTGENLNEHIVGEGWPPYEIRKGMLEEAIEIMRMLFSGEMVTYIGTYYIIESARLYTLPVNTIPIIISAYGPKSASLAGELGDGFISVAPNKKLVQTFEKTGGKGKPKFAQIHVCFDTDEERAIKTAYKYWRFSALKGPLNTELKIPQYFEQASEMVTEDVIAREVICGSNPDKYMEGIQKYADAGFDNIYLHQIGPDQESFLQFAKKEIIPHLDQIKT